MADTPKRSEATKEIGVSGVRVNHGMVFDEFLPELRGHRAIRKYREMSLNESTIGAILHSMDMLLRAVEWRTEPADDSDEAQREAEFVESVMEDMSHTYEEFISEVLSFLVYGWSYFETIYKRREGLDQKDPSRRSRFNDGRIGIRKLAPRAQSSLSRWEFDGEGGVAGMYQTPPNAGASEVFIPIEKALLFRTVTANNSPQGMSVLRRAYRSYWFLTNIQQYEAIAIERELNGLPVMKIPSEYLTDSNNAQVRQKYEQIARDVKFNEQGFALLPSDTYEDADGNPTNTPLVSFELMASSGTRDIDTGKVITRYQTDIARTVLADFIMLGQSERGSFALSKSKSDLFLRSLEGYLNNIAAVLNRHLLPRLWKLNGLNPDLMPRLVPGEVAPQDLEELGNFVQRIAGAGIPLGGDQDIEDALLETAGLPTDQREDPDMVGRTEKRRVRAKAGSRRV